MEYTATRRLGLHGPGAQPRHRHLRRRQRVLQGLGRERRRRGDAAGRHLPRGRRSPCSTRPTSTRAAWPRRSSARRSRAGATRCSSPPRAPSAAGPGPNDVGSSRHHLIARGRGEPAAARHRLHRPLSAARLRRADAGRGSARHARRPGARRQDPLHRLLELLRLAPDEVAGGLGEARPGALRRASGLLLAGRPRLRMGADAARARPEGRRGGLEPARLGPAHRQDPPRPAAAGRRAACRARSSTDNGPQVPDEYLYRVVDALDEVAEETGKTVPQIALNWLLQRPTVATRDHRRAQRGAAAAEPRRGRLEADAGAGREARRRQRGAAGLPVLAPARHSPSATRRRSPCRFVPATARTGNFLGCNSTWNTIRACEVTIPASDGDRDRHHSAAQRARTDDGAAGRRLADHEDAFIFASRENIRERLQLEHGGRA